LVHPPGHSHGHESGGRLPGLKKEGSILEGLAVADVGVAEGKVTERLSNIQAALHDLRPGQYTQETGGMRAADGLASGVHRNRVASLLINLYHLKDDARGLARAKGVSMDVVEEFCQKSTAVNLCIKAGDTYKHGVGGRDGNNTVIEYEVIVCNQEGPEPKPSDQIVNVVMLVIDRTGEPHQSDLLAGEALRDWAAFLAGKLGMVLPDWLKTWLQSAPPPGHSVYSGPMPPELLKHMKRNALARS
jgi:hypothetical protein